MTKSNKEPKIIYKTLTNQKLCTIIVMSRYLGSMTEEAIACMTELATRRGAGDTFDFESYIEVESKKLPDFKINIKKKLQLNGLDLALIKGIK